jgi:hypothetical protein
LRDHQTEITNKGANIAAIGLGGMNFARQFREEFKIDFPLLVDEDSSAHRAANLPKANLFHLFRSDNAAYRKRAKAAGFKQTGVKKDPFQLGGSFVFAPGNRDLFQHISQTFGDNAAISELVAAIPAT